MEAIASILKASSMNFPFSKQQRLEANHTVPIVTLATAALPTALKIIYVCGQSVPFRITIQLETVLNPVILHATSLDAYPGRYADQIAIVRTNSAISVPIESVQNDRIGQHVRNGD